MKPFSMFKLLTLASLAVYTGEVFGAGSGDPAGAGLYSSVEAVTAQNTYHSNACIAQFNSAVGGTVTLDPSTLQPLNDANYQKFTTSQDPNVKAALDKLGYCLTNTQPSVSDDTSCSKIESAINDDVKDMDKQCKNAPKVKPQSTDDDAIDTTDPENKPHTKWDICMWDAQSCTAPLANISATSNCTDMTLDDLARKTNNDTKELKKFCQDQYPAQCGSADKADLKNVAKDLDANLTQDLSSVDDEIKNKQQEIKENRDKLNEQDQKLQQLPISFAKISKAMQDDYENTAKSNNEKLDASLEKNYATITDDQNAIKAAALGITQADAANFDAKNKFQNACQAIAQKDTDAKYPMNGVNAGDPNLLITLKARRADFYQADLNSLYAGTTCDGGAYANTQLALLNAQKAEVQAEAQLFTDQTKLRTAMQQVAMKKSDASYKLLQDQQQKVTTEANQEKQEVTNTMTERSKLQQQAQTLAQELSKLQSKKNAGPVKRQCIQTIRDCARYVGTTSSSGDVPDLTLAPAILSKIVGECKEAANKCNKNSSTSKNQSDFLTTLKTTYKISGTTVSSKYFPFDPIEPCNTAIATDLEREGPIAQDSTGPNALDPGVTDATKQALGTTAAPGSTTGTANGTTSGAPAKTSDRPKK